MKSDLNPIAIDKSTQRLVCQHFEVSLGADGKLFDTLKKEVSHLLDHDLNALMNILYRIDLPEHKVIKILEIGAPSEVASELTKAIIERERQKVLTRIKYGHL